MKDTFKVIVPAEISKAEDGSYHIRGIATTHDVDSQGEQLLQEGLDLTPIDKRRAFLNWEHGKDPMDIIGTLDGYAHTKKGLQIEGTLFSKHTKAIAIREIMESLGKKDKHRLGLSVEGTILKRNIANPKIIEKCCITAVALTMKPVNSNTQVELIKSMSFGDVEFKESKEEAPITYSAEQVVTLLSKALGVGSGGIKAPNTRTGGDALAQEDLGIKKKKKLSKAEEIEVELHGVLDKLQVLYPYVPKIDLWYALKDRLVSKMAV